MSQTLNMFNNDAQQYIYNHMKSCATCLKSKQFNEFYKNKTTKDGYTAYCKICQNERVRTFKKNNFDKMCESSKMANRKYYQQNKTKIRQREINYRLKNTEKVRTIISRSYFKNKSAQRNGELKRQYGITLDEFNNLMLLQKGLCAICKKPEDERSNYQGKKSLSVDHNHQTGKVRGLLCRRCNCSIGLLNDSPQLIKAALEYLVNSEIKCRKI